MDERDLITHLRKTLEKPPILKSWLNDDCEIIDRGSHFELVTVDTSSEKADFPSNAPPFEIGYFSTALSLSDIAACGGIPEGILVSVSVSPDFDSKIFEIYEGVKQAANDANAPILGGDSNSAGEFSISVVSIGRVEKSKVLKRCKAREGDIVGVTGPLGNFNIGYNLYTNGQEVDYKSMLRQPARIEAGLTLSEIPEVTSCIDLPDGLVKALADNMSPNLGYLIDDKKIPIVDRIFPENFITSSNPAGDIELLFTANYSSMREVEKRFAEKHLSVFWIGEVVDKHSIRFQLESAQVEPNISGFIHKFEGYKLFP